METIRIDEDRMKVVLTKEDLARYGLSGRPLDPESEEVSRALRRLAADAGFTAGEGKLYLQLYESREGGCELFVTRLAAETERKGGYLALARREDAVLLARHLTQEGFRGPSRLFRGGARYFLHFPESIPTVACEFGSRLPDGAALYIEEYADPLLPTCAVERLAEGAGDAAVRGFAP